MTKTGTVTSVNHHGRFCGVASTGELSAVFRETDLAEGQSFWSLSVGDRVKYDSTFDPAVQRSPQLSNVTKIS